MPDKALEIDVNMWDVSSRLETKRIKEILAIPDNGSLGAVLKQKDHPFTACCPNPFLDCKTSA
ncbi:MAG: hypothetical protein NT178_04740 [Proteobacteria bacterium]|nr:hypothetical protein [Pseudomonadota bacterium]